MELKIINRYHPLRHEIEQFIKQKYLAIFYAKIKSFPTILLGLYNENLIKAACGIRSKSDGYFSQVYCKEDIEKIILKSENISHCKVCEIVNLVSTGPMASIKLVKELNKFYLSQNIDYAIFSGSENLRVFLKLLGLDVVEICCAEQSKIENPSDWGSYYETNPTVCYARKPNISHSLIFKNLKKLQKNVKFSHITQ
jgi:hypothetical protein